MSEEIFNLENRVKVAGVMLNDISDDIYSGQYSQFGRPNITSVQGVLHFPDEGLEHCRAEYLVYLSRANQAG